VSTLVTLVTRKPARRPDPAPPTADPAGQPQRQGHVLLGGERVDQVEALEDDPGPAQGREVVVAGGGDVGVAEQDRCCSPAGSG
jgi:hypothetical protein